MIAGGYEMPMASDGQPTKLRVDRDGVRIVETPRVRTGVWLLVAALGLVGIAVVMLVRPALHPQPDSVRPEPEPARNLPDSAASQTRGGVPGVKSWHLRPVGQVEASQPSVHLEPKPPGAPAPTPAALAEPPSAPARGAESAAPDEGSSVSGEEGTDQPTGIALFPPPGTKPILRGVLVPDDFELPEGYVRHFQATDDGQRVPAILMFHPDYQLVDEHGTPIPMPKDRVVPPEMVPPGLPVQMLEPPKRVPKPDIPVQGDEQDTTP